MLHIAVVWHKYSYEACFYTVGQWIMLSVQYIEVALGSLFRVFRNES
jgi:hypothetical protein